MVVTFILALSHKVNQLFIRKSQSNVFAYVTETVIILFRYLSTRANELFSDDAYIDVDESCGWTTS